MHWHAVPVGPTCANIEREERVSFSVSEMGRDYRVITDDELQWTSV